MSTSSKEVPALAVPGAASQPISRTAATAPACASLLPSLPITVPPVIAFSLLRRLQPIDGALDRNGVHLAFPVLPERAQARDLQPELRVVRRLAPGLGGDA